MNSIYSLMTLNCKKLGLAVNFMKYLVSVVSLIFLAQTLNWDKITFPASNLLNFAELVENESLKSIYKKICQYSYSYSSSDLMCHVFKGLCDLMG